LLRTIFNVALDDDKIAANPCRIRGGGKEPAHNERPLATEEQALAMANAVGPDYFAMVILAAWCSLRFGELAGLTRASIDPLHGKIHVRQQVVELAGGKTVIKTAKSDSGRTVEMPAAVVPVIKDHLAKYVLPDPDALVFTSPGGHRLRHTKFRLRWNQAKALAAVPIPADLTFHDLRGAGATWAAQDGATLAEIMHRLGHTTVAAAMRYQRTSADRNREIADRIGARFASAQSTVPDPDGNVVPIRRPRKAAAV
jgi:integrase